MEQKSLRTILIALMGVLIVLLLVAGWLIYSEATRTPAPTAVNEVAAATAVPVEPTATDDLPAELPAAQVIEFPTNTPTVTPIPTDTPVPTDTPLPTDTPVPPTNTRPPATAVPPTATPAPPTDTPVPPGPQPGVINGLIATNFVVQDWRTNPVVNGEIWYEWTIANQSGSPVPYSTIGVMPRRDGTDMVQWYQNNWGGNNDEMPVEGLTWPSWLSLPEPGAYTLRVVVCFDGFQTCLNGGGTFYTLSNEIPIQIN